MNRIKMPRLTPIAHALNAKRSESAETSLVHDGKRLPARLVPPASLALLSEDRLRLLAELAREPAYPAELAKRLDEQVQTVYYHVRLLQKAGLIEVEELEERGGALAKRYRATADALGVVINERAWKPAVAARKTTPPALFAPFIEGGVLDAKFVLGAPEPHGAYRGRGSEYPAVEAAMLLGAYASFDYPLYLLDTEVKDKHKKGNLVLFGGVKVNTLIEELNPHLPIRFDERTFNLESTLSGKKYGEGVGIIELVQNPWNKGKHILLVGGTNHLGTRAAVLALAKQMSQLEKGNTHDSSVIASVVAGFDEDSDGVVDAVEIYE